MFLFLGVLKVIIIVAFRVVLSITRCFNFFMTQQISSQSSKINKPQAMLKHMGDNYLSE